MARSELRGLPRPVSNQVLDALKKYDKIWVVNSFDNDVNSTKIRDQIRNGESVMDRSHSVMKCIKSHDLYQGTSPCKDSEKKEASRGSIQETLARHTPFGVWHFYCPSRAEGRMRSAR